MSKATTVSDGPASVPSHSPPAHQDFISAVGPSLKSVIDWWVAGRHLVVMINPWFIYQFTNFFMHKKTIRECVGVCARALQSDLSRRFAEEKTLIRCPTCWLKTKSDQEFSFCSDATSRWAICQSGRFWADQPSIRAVQYCPLLLWSRHQKQQVFVIRLDKVFF